jgi:hypothetical protein
VVGFGTFSVVARSQREGRNPRTGEKNKIPASKAVKFKGRTFSENWNGVAMSGQPAITPQGNIPAEIVASDNQVPAVTEGVDHALVNEAVQFINETLNRTLYSGAVQIGEYLLAIDRGKYREFALSQSWTKSAGSLLIILPLSGGIKTARGRHPCFMERDTLNLKAE